MGIGFAIPSNMAKPIMNSLLEHGKVARGYLGVVIQDVDKELAQALKLPSAAGVLVSDIAPRSPAEQAGIRRGDVIVAVDGKRLQSSGQLRNLIAQAGAKGKVKLDLLRDGKTRSVNVTLMEMPAEEETASTGAPRQSRPTSDFEGLMLQTLNPQIRSQLKLGPDVKQGVVVVEVKPGSAAQRAGLRPLDVLLEIDRQPVSSVADVKRLWQNKRPVLLLVHRGGSTRFLVVKP
jgi:S1-C subfamily serine protease